MTVLTVASAASADKAAWTEYLNRRQDATLFHDWRWGEVVEAVYGYRPAHFIARRSGEIVGVLPLIDVRSPLLGRSLISTAFSIGGGVVADDDVTAKALADAALAAGRALRVQYLELRGGARPEGWFDKSGVYAGFAKELPADAHSILGMIPRTRRAEVRKALASGEAGELSIRFGGDPVLFHRIYASSLRRLGTPAPPQRFFQLLADEFAEADIAVIESKGRAIASLFTFWFRDRAMPYYVGALDDARGLRAFDFLYYSLMQRAVERGARIFDFGRSRIGSPHYETKKFWGFEPAPLTYHVALVMAKKAPNVSPANQKFERLAAAWKRLPAPVANALGPALSRNFA